MSAPRAAASLGVGLFSGLGRFVQRHPWYPVIFWVLLLLVSLPFLGRLGTVTTNSATTLPSSAPSAVADAELARLFPNATAPSESVIVLTGANVTDPVAAASVRAVTSALRADPHLSLVSSVESFYSAYQAYLAGQVQIASPFLQPAEGPASPLGNLTLASAQFLWGPAASFTTAWQAMVAAHPSVAPASWNYPAYRQTLANFSGPQVVLLNLFYYGTGDGIVGPSGNSGGFNASLNCAAQPPILPVVSCADLANRIGIWWWGGPVPVSGVDRNLTAAATNYLGIENFTAPPSLHVAEGLDLAVSSGLPAGWLLAVWAQFPAGPPTPTALAAWTGGLVAHNSFPLPPPASLRSSFISSDNHATLVLVTFTQGSGYTTPSGQNPVYDDVAEIAREVPLVLAQSDPGHTLAFAQTGGAALDANESTALSQSLAIVLPLTIVVLIIITMLYFRAPVTPLLTFGGLGIALGLGVGGVLLIGTFITHVDVTALTLENTFVLGIGTDYSIFLVARYREELYAGAPPADALITTVTWAGQSVATSGATALLATLALAFSGVALLSQWGMVLSVAILITVLLSITLVPALLVLLGPRVFWPQTGAKFERTATKVRANLKSENSYFFRAGRAAQRRPKLIVTVVLLASFPLLYIALNVPINYDFYAQLPKGEPAINGLSTFAQHFGAGAAFPMDLLVTFSSPLIAGKSSNGAEWTNLSALVGLIRGTSGVAAVTSPVDCPSAGGGGCGGAPLAAWLAYPSLPPGTQGELSASLGSFVGTDGRTVVLGVVPASSGLSVGAVNLLGTLKSEVGAFAANHPDIQSVAYGGGASVTHDIGAQTALATQRMAILVSVGLIVVLLAVLRSWWIPPMAVATIGISIGWAWATTYLVLGGVFGLPLFYFVPTVLFILILGLGIDYNIFLLTRVREERLKGRTSSEAVVHAVAHTGGIITAAAIILASAFAILVTGNFTLLRAIGFAVAVAIVLDAMVVRTYLVPAALHLLGERVWKGFPSRRSSRSP